MKLARPEFVAIRKIVLEECGIVLGDGKEYLVEVRLRPLCKRHGIESFRALIQALGGRNPALLGDVVDAMTTNETSFFRDPPLWKSIRGSVLPDLIERRRGERSLRIWSAASSSGQEAYTLAILLHEQFPEVADWDVKILATDISENMLDRVRSGAYSSQEIGRGLPVDLRDRYFDERGDAWQARRLLVGMIEARQMNLVTPFPPLPQMDLILVRNVMIYFDAETRMQIIDQVGRVLRRDGYLTLGSSESIGKSALALARIDGASFYQRAAA